ncbi:MAG: hypothetical protein AAF733_10210 [Verrucomicrobiota bacterium]
MIRSSLSTLLLLILGLSSPVLASADPLARDFRPLEAKKVSIRPAVTTLPEEKQKSEATPILREAWGYFDEANWNEAMQSFLAALKADPDCREAAEGLAMSIYHSGDYDSAYRLGEELKIVMPNVRRMIAETALTDAQSMVAEGRFAEARAFLAHFPATGPTLAYAHEFVQIADTLTAAVNDHETQPLGAPLVRN